MKNLFLILLLIAGCNSKPKLDLPPVETFSTQAYHEQVSKRLYDSDSLVNVYEKEILKLDSIIFYQKKINDSLRTKLFLANFKIQKVKKYLNICIKNPTQDKFLKGWIRRAVE